MRECRFSRWHSFETQACPTSVNYITCPELRSASISRPYDVQCLPACGMILRYVHARTVRTAIVTLSKVNCCICARPASPLLRRPRCTRIRDESPIFSHATKRDPSIFDGRVSRKYLRCNPSLLGLLAVKFRRRSIWMYTERDTKLSDPIKNYLIKVSD